jgi:membrane protease subunit HflC
MTSRNQIAGAALGLLAFLGLSSLYTVGQSQKALVVRLGKPVGVIEEPGLQVKMPLVDSVQYTDTRLLALEPPSEQIILGDQKRIEVESFARFRIVDPLRYYQSVRTLDQARSQLAQIVSSSLRRELGQVMLRALLTDERDRITTRISAEVAERSRSLGIEVVDVGIRRADLPPETSQAIYDRMKSERQRQAKELRAQGFEWAQQIQGKADRERTVILSEAQRASKVVRGEGDAEANRLIAEAFGKDPQFFNFYRSLQTYHQALADSAPTIVLTPDTEMLRVFRSGPPMASRH